MESSNILIVLNFWNITQLKYWYLSFTLKDTLMKTGLL